MWIILAACYSADAVETAVSHGASLNTQNNIGKTALIYGSLWLFIKI